MKAMEKPENLMRQETSRLSSKRNELDEWIIDHSRHTPFGQTEYQCRNYVLEQQPTKYAAIRQACMEVSQREQAIDKIKINHRKGQVQIQLLKRNQEAEPDPLKKELIQCEIDMELLDAKVWEKKLLQGYQEQSYFLNYIKEECGDNEEEILQSLKGNKQEEDKYWIARMAKQSAVDMISTGTINAGNVESILQMPVEHQEKVLNAAMRYSGVVASGIDRLREQSESEIKYLDKDTSTRSKLLTDQSSNE